jgi:hypothetical protein
MSGSGSMKKPRPKTIDISIKKWTNTAVYYLAKHTCGGLIVVSADDNEGLICIKCGINVYIGAPDYLPADEETLRNARDSARNYNDWEDQAWEYDEFIAEMVRLGYGENELGEGAVVVNLVDQTNEEQNGTLVDNSPGPIWQS